MVFFNMKYFSLNQFFFREAEHTNMNTSSVIGRLGRWAHHGGMQLVVFFKIKYFSLNHFFPQRCRAHKYEHKLKRHRPVGEVGLPPWGPPKLRWPFLPTESSLSWESGLGGGGPLLTTCSLHSGQLGNNINTQKIVWNGWHGGTMTGNKSWKLC